MPAIKDFTTQYTAVANAGTISFPMPDYAQNDLLLAVITSDVNNASATWTLANWTVLYNVSNTTQPQQTVLWKIAGASETDPTFTRNVVESFNGALISIQDVNTTNPFGSPALYTNVSQAAAVKYSMPNLTTTVGDSLVLFVASNSCNALGFPNIIEGPVVELFSQDGLSESTGIGWTFRHSTGATSGVTANSVSSAVGINSTIQIAAPGGVATVIPTFIAADASIYIDPLNGTSAYNGNAAIGSTADTLFGTTIGARTSADGIAAAAAADSGLNPYHSAVRVGTITRTTNWAGWALDLAAGNNIDVTNKNVLVHIGPATPGQIQRFGAAIKGVGAGFGMLSTAGNWKVWHVHGSGTPWGFARDVPLIINSGNTSGVLTTTGSFNPAATDVFGFWLNGNGVNTTQWDFYQLWVLDTMTIAGGSTATPIDITGIINAVQGHEHRGVLLQGANQMLVLMPLQIGDGGTNPVYMDLNDTAIEFPEIYNRSSKRVNYCSANNVAGIIYYPGASDTIKHRNSIISSPSRYKWGLHASASTSATYDFSGLQVIGAGTITLNRAITVNELTINDYSTLDMSGITFNNGSILNMPATNDSLTTSSTTVISNSSITTTTVTAGNRWCSIALGDLDIFASNTFTGSHTTGHPIRISSGAGGSVTFVGNTFTTYGPTVFGFHTTTGVTDGTDVVTKVAHGYSNGDPIMYMKQGGTAAIGLTDATTYYVRAVTADTVAFYTTSANAIADTSRINLTGAGTETHYINSLGAAIYNDSGGAITITITGTTNVPSIRNALNSTTNVILSVNISLSVVNESNTPLQYVQVYFQKSATGKTWNYTSHNTNNVVGDTTFDVNEVVDTDLPQTGWLHVWDASTNLKQNYRYASWTGKTFTLPAEVTGTASSAGTSTTINSTGIGALNIQEGDTIRNTTDGSWAVVDELSTNSATTTALTGGSDNTWQNADAFSVHKLAVAYVNTDLIDIPIFNGQTDVNGDISTTYNYSAYSVNLPIIIRIRSNEGATKYIPYTTSAIITSSGYSGTVVLTQDTVAQ